MSIKISELPQATSVSSNDIVPIVQGGTTKQADISKFSNASSVPMGATFQYDGDTIPTGYEEVNGLETYSTTEQKVGTWINGKPLYEKTFTITSIPQVTTDGTAVDTKTNIGTNVDYAFFKLAFAISANATLPNYQPLPYINNAGRQFKSQITNNSGNLAVDIVSNGTAYNNYYMVVAVVNYTKSTDSAS